MHALQLQAVAGEGALLELEGAEIGLQIDGAQVGAVDQGDELERRRLLLPQLGQQVVLDDAGGDDVLDEVDVLSGDVDVVEKIDLDGVAGQRVGGVEVSERFKVTDPAAELYEVRLERDGKSTADQKGIQR